MKIKEPKPSACKYVNGRAVGYDHGIWESFAVVSTTYATETIPPDSN